MDLEKKKIEETQRNNLKWLFSLVLTKHGVNFPRYYCCILYNEQQRHGPTNWFDLFKQNPKTKSSWSRTRISTFCLKRKWFFMN